MRFCTVTLMQYIAGKACVSPLLRVHSGNIKYSSAISCSREEKAQYAVHEIPPLLPIYTKIGVLYKKAKYDLLLHVRKLIFS